MIAPTSSSLFPRRLSLLFYSLKMTDLQIWRAFRSRQRITIASDGGLKDRRGTHGWKIVSRSGQMLFSGSGPVDDPIDISHSTRSELGGLTAPLLLVMSLAKFWGIHHKCRYRWLTDSKAAISKVTVVTTTKYIPRRYPDDVDFITAIKELHTTLGGRKLKTTWIKGHQDEDKTYDELSSDAKLNVDADRLASEHYWSGHGIRPSPQTMHLAEYRITIAINGVIYPTRIDEQIRYHINGSYLKEYLQRHHGWSERTWKTIDIAAFGRHFKSLAGNKRVHHMKFIHNIQPIGVNKTKVHRSTDETLSQCPCCKAQEETQFHMLHCPQNPSRAKAIKALRTACRKSDGNRFSQVIGDILEQWLSNPDQTPSLKNRLNPFLRHEFYPKEYIDLINCAISQQADIGWHDMLRGFLSVKWHQLASSHFSSEDGSEIINRNDGANRVHRILRCIHTFANDIWKGRNEILHGNEKEKETRRLSAIDMEIRKLHDDVESVMTNDRFYCETSLNCLLEGSVANKRRWLLRVKASRKRKAELHARQPRITQYFTTKETQICPTTTPISSQLLMTRTQEQSVTMRNQKTYVTSKRNKNTQQLLTQFLRERASNPRDAVTTSSPPPTIQDIG